MDSNKLIVGVERRGFRLAGGDEADLTVSRVGAEIGGAEVGLGFGLVIKGLEIS